MNRQNVRPRNTVLDSVTHLATNGHSIRIFIGSVCLGIHVLKGATIKGKNMLPLGRIFFHLKVAPMRKENNFKGHLIEKPPKLNYANMSVF